MKRYRLFLSQLLLCAVLLSSCGVMGAPMKTKFTEYSLDWFDTVTTVTGYEHDRETFDAVCARVFSALGEYHRLYTIYHRFDGMENLCTVNERKDGAHRVVTVDRRIIDLLLYAKDMYTLTGGYMNIAMGAVLSVWHDYRTAGLDDPTNASLPPEQLLADAAQHTSIDDLIIDEEASTVFLADPEMTLDVGAIAKGYAVEMIAQMLEADGITGYVLNVGGNVRTIGTKPDGAPWIAGIENPDPTADGYAAYLALNRQSLPDQSLPGQSLVTSGSYQRFYTVNGKNYHHIIDADTLAPAVGFSSVSIVCRHSALADALSTALFCMTAEEGLALMSSVPDAEALWIAEDGTQFTTDGFASYVTEP